MLYYADRAKEVDPPRVRDRVVEVLRGAAALWGESRDGRRAAPRTHADLVGAAIALGELHQALADHLNPTFDDVVPQLDRLAAAATLLGRCVYRSARLLSLLGLPNHQGTKTPGYEQEDSWCLGALVVGASGIDSLAHMLEAAAGAVAEAVPEGLPSPLQAREPEGYAYYSLYPEMYFASAARAVEGVNSRSPCCVIGIRSIGASLATLVAGALEEWGFQARVETLRPRGHPFDRYVELGPGLRARLGERARAGARFLVVDEGPGLTCSSFLSVSSALEALGVEEDRVSILSAWQGAPSIYASDEIRARWRRQRVFPTAASEALGGWRALVPFVVDTLGGKSPPPGEVSSPGVEIRDLSYGRWREHLYPSPDRWPVVHRPTERTKLLLGESLLLKFAGLGEYGRRKYERAAILAGAGFAPPALGLAYGFLMHRFLAEARPMAASDLSEALLSRMVEYYAFVAERFRVPSAPRFDQLAELVLVNARKGMDLDAAGFVAAWEPSREAVDRLPMALLDGRPQPHEWLAVPAGGGILHLKADGADHFQDHTLVGEQSILWDLAGACEEWEMDEGSVARLLDLWETRTGDRLAARLLDLYRAAYLAFRLGGLHYAIHSTNEEDLRRSLQHEEWKFRHRFVRALSSQPTARGCGLRAEG